MVSQGFVSYSSSSCFRPNAEQAIRIRELLTRNYVPGRLTDSEGHLITFIRVSPTYTFLISSQSTATFLVVIGNRRLIDYCD